MKKVIVMCIMLAFMICLVSCKQEKQNDNPYGITHIELAYLRHLADPIILEDEETITKLASYIEKADGQKDISTKGFYGTQYILTLHYRNGNTLRFCLWDANRYSSSLDVDDEGFSYFYIDNVSEMFGYVGQIISARHSFEKSQDMK